MPGTSPKHSNLCPNITIQEDVGFLRKPEMIQESLSIVDILWKLVAHCYAIFHIGQGHLVLDVDLVVVKFEILNQNKLNRRYREFKFLAPPSQRPGRILVDWLINPSDILRYLIVIGDPVGEKPVALRFSQMPWTLMFLTNLQISCLEICWNWTSFCILFEQSWET